MKVLIYIPVDVPEAAPSDIGGHITLVYSDEATGDRAAFVEAITGSVDALPATVTPTGERSLFGPDADVPVALLPADELAALRSRILARLAERGASARATWDEYRPHVSLAEGADAPTAPIECACIRLRIDGEDIGEWPERRPATGAVHFAAAADNTDPIVAGRQRFRVLAPGPNRFRDSGEARATLTADDLRELARVDEELRGLGQHTIKLDWHHLSSPAVFPELVRTPDNMAPLGVAALDFAEDERGPGLYATIDWNHRGRELVKACMTDDGRGTLWPSCEVHPTPVHDKRTGAPIGRMWVRAIGLQGDQQQPDIDLDAMTALAAIPTPADDGDPPSTAGTGEETPTMEELLKAAATLGLADEEMADLRAKLEAAGDGALTAYTEWLKAHYAKGTPEPAPEPPPAPEPMAADTEEKPADVMQALAAFEAGALKREAGREAKARGVVPAQEAAFVHLFVAAHGRDPDKAAVEALAAWPTSGSEPSRTTIDRGPEQPNQREATEARYRKLFARQGG